MSQNPTPPMTTPKPRKTVDKVEAEYAAILAAFRVTALILAVRAFLFMSLIGAFVLSMIATENGSPQSAYVLFIYSLVTILPVTLLEWKGKRG